MLKPIKGQPGRFLETTTGQVLNISDYREDDKYDTIVIYGDTLDPITWGKQYVFFRDIERKLQIDTNFTQPVRLSMGEEMVLDRVGLSIDMFMGDSPVSNTDMAKIIYNGHLRVNVNNLLLIEGPSIKFGSGYGLTGPGVYQDATAVASFFANLGMPSPAAVPKLVRTQTLTEKHEIIGYFTFYSRNWADWKLGGSPEIVDPPILDKTLFIPVKCWLHGLLKVAVNK